ncbi:MAG TPA: BlaI/MecI/CopY family transcriptional regulator [Bryobacteraceae bacterium]|jgi:predicted transcriptional regulator|nr:BlaI/MecI/CopY family transcriptional regulator [Bryobacteraceae bacterium]
MMGLFRNRSFDSSANPPALGPLEIAVMEILWDQGESNVHDVVQRIDRPLAYTTVMTTLDRLYKKGLLSRHKSERAFLYSTRQTRLEWEQKRAGEFVAGFLNGPQAAGEMLISCLVEAVGQKDAALLDDLERKIRVKRRELSERRKR